MKGQIAIYFLILFVSSKRIAAQTIMLDTVQKVYTWKEVFFDCWQQISTSKVDTVFYVIQNDTLPAIVLWEEGVKIKATGYYNDSCKARVSNFRSCYLDGEYTLWHKNGRKAAQTFYENGVRIFPLISWYENGIIKEYSDYDEKTNTGVVLEWYENGLLKNRMAAVDSTKHGVFNQVYYENGKLAASYFINMGKQLYVLYYPEGSVACEGYIKDAVWIRVGKWTAWHKNGTKQSEMLYSNSGLPEGIWQYWNEKGRLIKQETYFEGKLQNTKELRKRRRR